MFLKADADASCIEENEPGINHHSLHTPMAQSDITKKGEEIIEQVTQVVEDAGKKVADQVSNLTGAQPEALTKKATEEAIQTAVDQAIDILQVAGDKVREKGINTERVTLKAGVGIPNIAQLEISTDVPSKNGTSSRGEGFEVEVS